jgi:membrane protease YdiL (CAAX protease family)
VHRHPAFVHSLGAHLPYAAVSFALLLAPLWFFGFGAGTWLRDAIHPPVLRILLASLLGTPYLAFAIPAHLAQWSTVIVMFLLPLVLAAFLEFPSLSSQMVWRDAVVLAVLAATYMLGLLAGAWPYAELATLPKLYVADVALYLYIVVRKLEGTGYSLLPRLDAVLSGLREWVYFLPIGIGLGLAIGFVRFHPRLPSVWSVATAMLATVLLVAIPEELFFRGILQNLLETRVGPRIALAGASVLFGLAHFNKGASFNWRYVLLAAIAGVFYGRAWRERRQLLASVITHAAVDVAWSLWFR